VTRLGRPPSARKKLRALLTEMFDDGTGQVAPLLAGLLENLVSMPRPTLCRNWLRNNAHARDYLRGLAHGDIPLSHEALLDLPSWRTAAHLCDLLMAAGALVAVDRQILLFERWYRSEVKALADPQHAQALRQFTTWRLLPRMRARAANQFLTSGTRNAAAHEFSKARQYLVWLAGRGRCLQDSTQADIDAWYATATDPDATRTFLKWAIASRAMPRLDVPARRHAERAPISQHRRLALIHRFLTDKRIELRTRVAGCLLLLYAQPVSRLARLTLDDIITGDDGQVFIRLGDPPTPVPEPFAAMLTELAANRVNMNTAANPGCQWLFPGQRVGQPLMPIGLRRQLHELGIPLTQARTAAFRQLVLQAPPPVVARSLGFDYGTATEHAIAAGGTWNRYPAARRDSTLAPLHPSRGGAP
jgi:hypothetical protein